MLLPLLKPICCAVDKAPKPQKQKTSQLSNYPSVSDIYLTCVHAASSSSTLRVITQYFDISVRKKKQQRMTKQKKTIARILTINLSASAFQAE